MWQLTETGAAAAQTVPPFRYGLRLHKQISKHPWIQIPNEVPEYLVARKIEYILVWIGAGRREWDDEWHNEDERPLGDAITDTEMNQFPAVSAVLFSLSQWNFPSFFQLTKRSSKPTFS